MSHSPSQRKLASSNSRRRWTQPQLWTICTFLSFLGRQYLFLTQLKRIFSTEENRFGNLSLMQRMYKIMFVTVILINENGQKASSLIFISIFVLFKMMRNDLTKKKNSLLLVLKFIIVYNLTLQVMFWVRV